MVPLAAWRQSHGHQGGEVNESAQIMEETRENVGAGVMGRNMFGPVGGGDWGWALLDVLDRVPVQPHAVLAAGKRVLPVLGLQRPTVA